MDWDWNWRWGWNRGWSWDWGGGWNTPKLPTPLHIYTLVLRCNQSKEVFIWKGSYVQKRYWNIKRKNSYLHKIDKKNRQSMQIPKIIIESFKVINYEYNYPIYYYFIQKLSSFKCFIRFTENYDFVDTRFTQKRDDLSEPVLTCLL